MILLETKYVFFKFAVIYNVVSIILCLLTLFHFLLFARNLLLNYLR